MIEKLEHEALETVRDKLRGAYSRGRLAWEEGRFCKMCFVFSPDSEWPSHQDDCPIGWAETLWRTFAGPLEGERDVSEHLHHYDYLGNGNEEDVICAARCSCGHYIFTTEILAMLNEHAPLKAQVEAREKTPFMLGGYIVSDLLKVIADDYRNPKAAQIIRDVRGLWLEDLAALLEKERGT